MLDIVKKRKEKQELQELYRVISENIDIEYYLTVCKNDKHSIKDPVTHYIKTGCMLRYDPTPWFSTGYYLDSNPDVVASKHNPFYHYIKWGKEEGRPPVDTDISAGDLTISDQESSETLQVENTENVFLSNSHVEVAGYFDADFYRATYQDLSHVTDPLAHYLEVGWKEGRDPAPWFSTQHYLDVNPDVFESNINPFVHYVLEGWMENREIKPKSKTWQDIRQFCNGEVEWHDYQLVKDSVNSFEEENSPDLDVLSFCTTVRGGNLNEFAKEIIFPLVSNPSVSIIIPCVDEVSYTLECLKSLQNAVESYEYQYEVIIFDNGSVDETEEILSRIKNLTYIREEKNIGFGPANNKAAEVSRGEYLFFLNNDAQIAPDAIDVLQGVLLGNNKIGAVGPKLMCFDGRLQEAGAYVDAGGNGKLVGFGKDHRIPRFSYSREVEYVSGAALLMAKSLFHELGGFDPIYAPAYCEDSDLCFKLRSKGLSIFYVHQAVVAHHLSVTSNQGKNKNAKKHLAISNQQKFVERWQEKLTESAVTRLVAFYLPQFHPIPENDRWWGKGFTEWTNIAKAKPNYEGHRQPRVPGELGYYDLRLPEMLEAQAALAKRYGLYGFCYYYYWFDGKRLLETPLEQMLATGKPEMPFCLCWANENWTRTWDGKEDNILMGQNYCEENDIEVIRDLLRYLKSPYYIKINGKPLLLVYRIKQFPNFLRTARIWRNYCESHGLGEIILAMVESFELSPAPEDPRKYGCDISVEFPPHGMVHDSPIHVAKTNARYEGTIHDYKKLVFEYIRREEPGFKRLRTVLAGWDSTPRHQDKALVLEHATPGAFQAWLEWTMQRTREQNIGDERIVFINAWNEWCEGSYLEPDTTYGHAYLQAIRNALEGV